MIPTFVINLDRSTDRLEHITKEFARARLRFNRFPAIEGHSIPQDLQPYFQGCALLPGEIGCYASHLALWHRIASGECGPEALICEDDIALPEDMEWLLENILSVLEPGNWDVVRLSSTPKRAMVRIAQLIGGRALVKYSHEPTNTGATLVSRAGARKLIRPRVVRRPVDQDLRCSWELKLTTYGVEPNPILHNVAGASIIGSMGGTTAIRRADLTRGWRNHAQRIAHNISSLGFSNWARCLAWNTMVRKLKGAGTEFAQMRVKK